MTTSIQLFRTARDTADRLTEGGLRVLVRHVVKQRETPFQVGLSGRGTFGSEYDGSELCPIRVNGPGNGRGNVGLSLVLGRDVSFTTRDEGPNGQTCCYDPLHEYLPCQERSQEPGLESRFYAAGCQSSPQLRDA